MSGTVVWLLLLLPSHALRSHCCVRVYMCVTPHHPPTCFPFQCRSSNTSQFSTDASSAAYAGEAHWLGGLGWRFWNLAVCCTLRGSLSLCFSCALQPHVMVTQLLTTTPFFHPSLLLYTCVGLSVCVRVCVRVCVCLCSHAGEHTRPPNLGLPPHGCNSSSSSSWKALSLPVCQLATGCAARCTCWWRRHDGRLRNPARSQPQAPQHWSRRGRGWWCC